MVKGEMDVARNGSSPSRAAGAKYDSVGVTHDAYGKVYQLPRPNLGGSAPDSWTARNLDELSLHRIQSDKVQPDAHSRHVTIL